LISAGIRKKTPNPAFPHGGRSEEKNSNKLILNKKDKMKTKVLLLVAAMILSAAAYSQAAPEPASKILADAYKQAAKEKKNVMVIFHASWCGWCKKMDASIEDPSCKAFFDKSYVIIHLTILESKDKKNLENPEAEDIYNENGGKGGGIPYFLIYDKKGKLLSDSKFMPAKPTADGKPTNLGCPAADDEVAAFIEILKKTSKINEAEIQAVTERFKKNRS
jgi:thioredoxin-related protein